MVLRDVQLKGAHIIIAIMVSMIGIVTYIDSRGSELIDLKAYPRDKGVSLETEVLIRLEAIEDDLENIEELLRQ